MDSIIGIRSIDNINTIEQIYVYKDYTVKNFLNALQTYRIGCSIVPNFDYTKYNYLDTIFDNTIEQQLVNLHIPFNDIDIGIKKINDFLLDYKKSYDYFISIGLDDNIPLINYIKITLGFSDTLRTINIINQQINMFVKKLNDMILYHNNQKQLEEINNTIKILDKELNNP